ncbi:MAG: LysR family transcriptional regulator [Pseudomonas fluorescens]|nr:LysR family transcriptional regulator [Pseudomonas fluorescens]
MNVSLRHIEVFRAIMQAGSVTGAARLLLTSQPTLSRELARFESLSGLRLFDREGGKLVPTAQAVMLLEEVERSYIGLERINSVAQSIRRFEHGQLSITCLPLFSQTLLPNVCKQFHQQHSGIGLSITAQESPLLEESLSAQRHDGLDIYRQKLDEHFRLAGVDRHTVIETTNAASVCAMVRQQLGVAIINPLSAVQESGRGLAIRPINVSIPYRVMLIRPDFRPSSVFVDAFCKALRVEALSLASALDKRMAGASQVDTQ